MTELSLALFDPVLVTVDGEPPPAPLWSKTLALLAYLAVEADRPHRRETLAGLLWPEEPETAARHSLRQALSQLRQALGEGDPPFLLVTAQTVAFNPAWSGTVDVAKFTRLLAACQQHLHRRLETCRACVERLERVAALYRGDLLGGLFLKDSVGFDEWVLVQRERFSRQALLALHTLADHYGRCGDYGRMEQMARREIEIDPYHEEAHRQLLRALAWSGQPNAALAHYAALCRMLAQDLGVSPEGRTAALQEQIRAGSLSPPVLSPLRNWPAPLTPLIGREAELAALAELLQPPQVRLVTVTGAGGVGKTRLALEVAAQEAWGFADGACFVPLAAVLSPEFVVPAIATALELPPAGPLNPQAQLSAQLRDKDLLLVLDNLEHLVAGAASVVALLAACPRLRILTTSREPLHLRAEQQFPLAPLALPPLDPSPGDVATLAGFPAVQLFVQRARAVQPTFALDEQNAPAVAEICRHLDGLPLAIELAAARVGTLALPEMLARRETSLALLVNGFHDLPPRQRTLRATLDWSYSLLADQEERLFARLAVFAGGCTQGAAQAVCGEGSAAGDTLAADLQALVDKSLLQCWEVSAEEPRFSMLETIHEYAAGRLADSAELTVFRDRHARYYLDLAEQAMPYLGSVEGGGEMKRLEQERNNLRAALQWAQERGDGEVAVRLGAALWQFWNLRGDYLEGRHWLEAILRLPSPIGKFTGSAGTDLGLAWRRVLVGAGVLAGEQGEYARAVALLEQALALSREIGDRIRSAWVLAWLGWAAGELGDYDRAISAYEEAMALYQEREDTHSRYSEAFILNGLGNVAQYRGDWAAARAYHEKGLAMSQKLGHGPGIACATCSLGLVAHEEGHPEQAARLLREGMGPAWQDSSCAEDAAAGLLGLADVLLAQGQAVRGAVLLGQAAHLFESLGVAFSRTDRVHYDRAHAAARAALGEEAFAVAWAEGQSLPREQAFALALEEGGAE